jgi:hypothetical protein
VLVLVDEDAEAASQALAQELELLPQLAVVVAPGVAWKPSFIRRRRGTGCEVAERRRDDRAGVLEERLGMAGNLGLRHRETHAREQAAVAPLADMPLGLLVGAHWRCPDDIDPELLGDALELALSHEAEGSSRNRPVRMAA